jgi:hypothetical protein
VLLPPQDANGPGRRDFDERKVVMKWSFWKHDDRNGGAKAAKLPKPKDLPSPVGRHLVVDLQWDPDTVWQLKSVAMPVDGQTGRQQIRIFDPAKVAVAGVTVKDFPSLDPYPELIILEGWFDKSLQESELHPPAALPVQDMPHQVRSAV